MPRTLYETLGVERDASRGDIKHAYYELRKRFAALKKPTQAQRDRLVRINAAWDILKIDNRRAAYDLELGLVTAAPEHDQDDADAYEAWLRREEVRKAASTAAAASAAAAKAKSQHASRTRPPPSPDAARASNPARIRRRQLPGGAKYWAMGGGIAVAYVLLSAAVQRTPPTPPPPMPKLVEATDQSAHPKPLPSKRHRLLTHRHATAIHRRHSTQDAAEMNRLELQRLKQSGGPNSRGY